MLYHVPIILGLMLVTLSAARTVGYLEILFKETVVDIYCETRPIKIALRVMLLFALLAATLVVVLVALASVLTILYVLTGWPA